MFRIYKIFYKLRQILEARGQEKYNGTPEFESPQLHLIKKFINKDILINNTV